MPDQAETQSNSPPTELFSLLGKILEAAPTEAPPAATQTSTEPQKAGEDMLSALLSNPEIISKLPQILSMIKPLMEGMSGASAPAMATPSPEAAKAEPPSVSAGLIGGNSHRSPDCRSALLYAMKPYLKRERQEAIDYMVKLSKLGDILKSL